MRDPCQSKWSSGKWSQLWSRHQKLWSRPLKPGTRRFRAPVLSSILGWSIGDSNPGPLACQARAGPFNPETLRLDAARLSTSAAVQCRPNCGPNYGPIAACGLSARMAQ
jgi:hypothetical protein